LHILEFDDSYMKDNVDMRAPQDTMGHPMIDYATSWKALEEAREINPYAHSKISSIDYRF